MGTLAQAGTYFPIDEPTEEQKEAAKVYVYTGSWSFEVPCMYCGAGSWRAADEDETCIAYQEIKGAVCQILYCAVESKPCMARSREDRDKVDALFAAHRAEKMAKKAAAEAEAKKAEAKEEK